MVESGLFQTANLPKCSEDRYFSLFATFILILVSIFFILLYVFD
jgi:hypothetical protein